MRIFEIFDFETFRSCKVIGRWSLLHVYCFNYLLTSPVNNFWISLCVNTSRKKSQVSSGVILSRNTYRKIDSNACEKKKFVWNGKAEEGENIV